MRKLFVSLFIVVILLANMSIAAASKDYSGQYLLSEDEAMNVAYNFLLSNMSTPPRIDSESDLLNNGVTEELSVWKEGIRFNSIIPLYGLDNNINAYMFELSYENNVPAGYIVVNTNRNNPPIVEFSFSQLPFLYQAEEIIRKTNNTLTAAQKKFYYLGGLTYVIGFNDGRQEVYYDITVTQPISKSKTELRQIELNSFSYSEEYDVSKEWAILLDDSAQGSNPPVGEPIYIPGNYESGWEDCTYDWCYGMGNSYFTMDYPGFQGPNNCAPTAGTNYCKYWTLRDPSIFSSLYPGSWATLHNTLYVLMKTNEGHKGTYDSDLRTGLVNYIDSRCHTSPTSSYKYNASTVSDFDTWIKAEINNGRPVILSLQQDQYYGNHAVVGFGYIRYKYSGAWRSHYILLADGWRSIPDRYIHYQTGRDHMNVIRINPY